MEFETKVAPSSSLQLQALSGSRGLCRWVDAGAACELRRRQGLPKLHSLDLRAVNIYHSLCAFLLRELHVRIMHEKTSYVFYVF